MALTNINQLANHGVINSERQQASSSPHSKKHIRLMAELWVRMEDLFNNQWSASNGMASLSNHRFETWCRKLVGLSLEEFGRGFENLEEAKASAAQEKKSFFPPDYATFIGYTRKPADAVAAQQARQSDTRPLMITRQPTEAEREFGNQQSAALKGLFG